MPNDLDRHEEPPSPLRQIDLVADHFETEHRQGGHPRIADYLDKVPVELRRQLLLELICIDLEHRLRKRLSVSFDDYVRQFPELENLPPADWANLESHVRRLGEERGRTTDFVSPAPGPTPDIPRTIGRFTIAGRLASGGQADAFFSFHPEFKIPVVIKWHHAHEPCDTVHRERLVDEGRILAGLGECPNLLRVYEIGFHEGRAYLVLEHVQGRTLDHYFTSERPIPSQAGKFVAELAESVHAAHAQGVVHQDIKPSNVLIDGREKPRLIDFGLAWFRSSCADREAGARPDAGTLEYLSPEQADPKVGPVGPWTDVFGLGAVLYFLLTGRALYDGAAMWRSLRQAAAAAYDNAALDKNKIPKRLAVVCRKALARDPQARFATAAEMATALKAAVRRPRWRGVAALAGLLLAAVMCGWLLGQPSWHRPEPAIGSNQPALAVRVWRKETLYTPLSEALPVRNGDELQVRFRVPAGLHVGLFSVNGRGELVLLEQYPPREAPAELAYPAAEKTRSLGPPAGTELFLVCGRSAGPVSEAEVHDAWGDALPLPALASRRLLRLQVSRVKDEGDKQRNLDATHDRPESDPVVHRLDELRERLTAKYPFFEGLAFRHE